MFSGQSPQTLYIRSFMRYASAMEYISISEAARILGYRRSNVYALAHNGRLPVLHIGTHRMVVDRSAVEALAQQGKPKRGRPRKSEGASDAENDAP